MKPSDKFFDQLISKIEIEKNDFKSNYEIEKRFYEALASCLKNKYFDKFEKLIDFSVKLDIFLDVKKIPDRFMIFSNHIINCIQVLDLGEVIEILRFCNKLNLFDKEFSAEEIGILENFKKDKLFMANLRDLFGAPSNSFILYVKEVMPLNLYYYFINYFKSYSFASDDSYNIHYVLEYLNDYTIYGLSVKFLCEIKEFINKIENISSNTNSKYIEFYFYNQKHLASRKNLKENFNKILLDDKEYKFYSLTMVLLGGLGPQGHGFTYSTPKGEIVEICSDIRETEAIIVKYKQFLKQQFLIRLEKELMNLTIDSNVSRIIIKYLTDILNPKELINYYKRDSILEQIRMFLKENQEYQYDYKRKFQELINKISNAITLIFRKIKLQDQFKTRMDLIAENKLRSEDIAKLTSLKNKSHYDVLRERFFFQCIVKWFYEIYTSKNF